MSCCSSGHPDTFRPASWLSEQFRYSIFVFPLRSRVKPDMGFLRVVTFIKASLLLKSSSEMELYAILISSRASQSEISSSDTAPSTIFKVLNEEQPVRSTDSSIYPVMSLALSNSSEVHPPRFRLRMRLWSQYTSLREVIPLRSRSGPTEL